MHKDNLGLHSRQSQFCIKGPCVKAAQGKGSFLVCATKPVQDGGRSSLGLPLPGHPACHSHCLTRGILGVVVQKRKVTCPTVVPPRCHRRPPYLMLSVGCSSSCKWCQLEGPECNPLVSLQLAIKSHTLKRGPSPSFRRVLLQTSPSGWP